MNMAPGQVPCHQNIVLYRRLFGITEDGVVPALTVVIRELDHDVLDLRVVLEGVYRHVLADTAFLVATVGHFGGKGQVVVDPDGAELQGAAGAHGREDVGCPDGRGQAKDDIVGFLQYFFLCAEAADDDDGAKDFILHNLGVVAVFGDDGRLEEKALLQTRHGGAPAACDDIGAVAQRTLDEALNGRTLGGGDQRTHVGAFLRGVADANRLDLAQEGGHEFVVDAVLHIDARGRGAVLAAVDEAADDRAISGGFDVGILVDDKWGLAA